MIDRIAAWLLAAMLIVCATVPALADDFTDQLDQAKAAYGSHDLRGAQKALDTAATLLRQQRLAQWKTVLPEPLAGWQGETVEGAAAAMALMGGGVSVSRRYRHDGHSVSIEIISDSPLVTTMASFLNGMIISAGAELVIVDGRKINYRKSENSYTALVADKAMVTVKGMGGVADGDLRAYVKAIHFDRIEALVK